MTHLGGNDGTLSPALEDHLRKMCELGQDGDVKSAEIARELGVSRPSGSPFSSVAVAFARLNQ